MGFYKRLLQERVEEERRRGGPLPGMRGVGSKVLIRRLENAPSARPKYAADVSMMHRLIKKGPRNAGEGMRLGSLKAKYPDDYGELIAKRRGQQELL